MSLFDLTEAQAAAELGCSQRQLASWRKRGLVPFVREPGGRVGYTEGQVSEIRHKARYRPDGWNSDVLRSEG